MSRIQAIHTPTHGHTLCVFMWALKSAPQLAAFWCIRVQFAAKVALSTTNAGVRREVIGLPTNASFKAFLSGVPERYRGDGVCMVDEWKRVYLGHRCVHDQINDGAELSSNKRQDNHVSTNAADHGTRLWYSSIRITTDPP